ncbi:MAG TPA: AAA family ATPase [Baekduia sp.]|uniref:helix-turn-helix transcriptional regulator n=1 Tax=Baekduia sp. TaxID=2600305 RepID=UPI002D78A060|nr:AAA family ATPase [Baekduia sp.]HET6510417.1 AAA family ATPase [Baekduia sp.]
MNLIGRRAELARLALLADAVRAGRGGALLVEGGPGVGKSALVEAVDWPGVLVLRATGVETEIDLPFAGIAELLDPILDRVDALPDVQATALRGALALAAPPPAGEDRGLVLHAVAGLLRAVASERPLAVHVDDVQWLDPSSREVVAFAARRAPRLGTGFVVVRSLRGLPTDHDPWPGVERVALAELGRADALALARTLGVGDGVAERLVDTLGGNPLALTSAPPSLSEPQRAGAAALPDPLPVAERLQRAFGRRLDGLDASARHALLLLAASSDGDAAPLAAALRDDGLAAAEGAGLVVRDARHVRFHHPLVRTAVVQEAGPAALRAAHRALAEVTDGPARAWHRAAAAEAPDETLAAALEALGHQARERGAVATAATVFERAAALSPEPRAVVARTVTAAAMANLAGRPAHAQTLLDALLPALDDPLARADVQLLRGMAMQQTGRPLAALALLEREAEAVRERDPFRAAGLLTQASITLMAYGTVDRIEALAARAMALAGEGADLVPAVLHAEALVSQGEHARARAQLDARQDALDAVDPTGPGHEILSVAALCRLWMEDYEDAERLLVWLVDSARARGAAAPLAFPLAVLATVLLRRGSFAAAMALAQESQAQGEEAVGGFVHSLAVTAVAFVAAHQGDARRCLEACEQARAIAERLELTSTLACVEQARGFLALGEGDAERAIGHLERARALTARFGNRDPSFLYTDADLVEAYSRAGRIDEARALTAVLADGAARTGGAWAAAATARCRALTGPDDDLDAQLADALAAHARVPLRFEEARTRLCLGERLRRARRRADARPLLAAAHETFVALGAPHWARRAAQELAAAGGRRTDQDSDGDADLTPREREVCRLVAGGATNAEVAASLFLSARTVEHHLRMAYRKLGVRSRSELANRFNDAV